MNAMKGNRSFALAAALFAVVAIAGCGDAKSKTDAPTKGQAKISANLDLGSEVTRVTLTITGLTPPVVQDLTRVTPSTYSTTVANLPPGGPYVFSVEGFNGTAVVLRGQANNVTIVAGQTAQVSITLTEPTPPTGPVRRLPVIDALAASTGLVDHGGTVNVSVTAHSPENHALTYLWADSCGGSFAAPTATSTVWTAPAQNLSCQLSVRIADAVNATAVTGYMAVTVQRATGSANVNVTVNTYPVMTIGTVEEFVVFQNPPPANLTVGITATIAATASDPDGSAVTLAWTSSCAGTFSPSATVANVTFHTDNPNAACTLTLTATDPTGQSISGLVHLSGFACANVTCNAGQACDPADGLCKDLNLCTGVTCPPATSLCTVAGTCNVATGTCSAETPRVCAAGTTCDPADGVCKPPPDLCAGVTCTATSLCNDPGVCNPASGVCSAETPKVCATGTTCDPADGVCKPPANLCAGVTCTATSLCNDPGVCNPASGVCSAETPKVCATGTTCDPADGVCKAPPPATPVPNLQRADGQLVGEALGLALDSTGALYRAGSLTQAFDFGSGTVTPAGSADLWLGRFDPNTAQAVWAFGYGDTADQFASGLAVTPGRVGMIGSFTGTLDLGGLSASNPSPDIALPFVAVLNPASASATVRPVPTFLKTVNLNGGGLARVAAHPTANRFAICGTASAVAPAAFGATDLVPGATGGGAKDIVVALIDETAIGGVVWARQIGGTGDQTCGAVAFDPNGNVVITGTYAAGVLDFGAGALTAPTGANVNVYVARLAAADGAIVQSAGFGGVPGRAAVNAIAVASNGEVALAGAVLGRITFGTVTVIGSGTSTTDAYVVKLASDFTVAAGWPVRIGGAVADTANTVVIDGAGQVWTSGSFSGTTTSPGADGRGAVALTSAGGTDVFLVRFSPAGAVTFSGSWGDAFGQASTTLVSPAAGQVWMGGTFGNSVTFGTLPALTSTAGTDIRNYVVRFQ